jgi:hypothetical protein
MRNETTGTESDLGKPNPQMASEEYFPLLSPGCADGSGKALEKQAFFSVTPK